MNKLTWWHVVGAYLGYPDCCIENFVSRMELLEATKLLKVLEEDQQVFWELGTGFIPCPDCATKIIKNNILLSSLIKNRICPVKFPADDLHLIHKP